MQAFYEIKLPCSTVSLYFVQTETILYKDSISMALKIWRWLEVILSPSVLLMIYPLLLVLLHLCFTVTRNTVLVQSGTKLTWDQRRHLKIEIQVTFAPLCIVWKEYRSIIQRIETPSVSVSDHFIFPNVSCYHHAILLCFLLKSIWRRLYPPCIICGIRAAVLLGTYYVLWTSLLWLRIRNSLKDKA
jgi:hypothetical protein